MSAQLLRAFAAVSAQRLSGSALPFYAVEGIARITTEEQLRRLIGEPTAIIQAKLSDRVNELTRRFIERSPFVCVATAAAGGGIDVSPRGDPPATLPADQRTAEAPAHRVDVSLAQGKCVDS